MIGLRRAPRRTSRRQAIRVGSALVVSTLSSLSTFSALALGAAGPTPIAPGQEAETAVLAPGECPTFRWIESEGADGYELALFALGLASSRGTDDGAVLRVGVAAGAGHWTPPPGWCPAAGQTYAWAVRMLDATDQEKWSEPMRFRVAAPARDSLAGIVAALRGALGEEAADAALRKLLDRAPSPPRSPFLDSLQSTAAPASAGGALGIGASYIGTVAFQEFELRAGGARALLLQPTSSSPNIAGGSADNVLAPDKVGATISGGGDGTMSSFNNRVTEIYGTVLGGRGQSADHGWATVGGGRNNVALGQYSTVSGGAFNTAIASESTVAGGAFNNGGSNLQSAYSAAVGGGLSNSAAGDDSAIPGGSSAVARDGQLAYSSGSFVVDGVSYPGTAQWTLTVLRGTTTDATPTDLAIDAAAQLEYEGTLALDIQVVARSDAGTVAAYTIEGVAEGGSNLELVGTPAVNVLGEDDPSWDVDIATDQVNRALDVIVTGAAGATVRWVATVRATVVDGAP